MILICRVYSLNFSPTLYSQKCIHHFRDTQNFANIRKFWCKFGEFSFCKNFVYAEIYVLVIFQNIFRFSENFLRKESHFRENINFHKQFRNIFHNFVLSILIKICQISYLANIFTKMSLLFGMVVAFFAIFVSTC